MLPPGPVWAAGVLVTLGGAVELLTLGWAWLGVLLIVAGFGLIWRGEMARHDVRAAETRRLLREGRKP